MSFYSTEILADSPVAWWRCDDASGSLTDSSGNTRTATLTGTGITYNQTGAITSDDASKAIKLSGTATYATATIPALTSTWSIECWYAHTTSDSERHILDTDSVQIYMDNSPSTGSVHVKASTSSITYSTNTSGGGWHHIVATYNGTTLTLYVDGVSRGTPVTVALGSLGDTHARIGTFGGGVGTLLWNDLLDEGAIYSTALSATRVSAHYTVASARSGWFVPGFDATDDATLWDATRTNLPSGTSITQDTSTKYSGRGSIQVNTGAAAPTGNGPYIQSPQGVCGATGRASFYFYTATGLGSGTTATNPVTICFIKTGSFHSQLSTGGDGKLGVGTGNSTIFAVSTFAMATSTWYRLCFTWNITNATTFTLNVYVDPLDGSGATQVLTTSNSGTLGGETETNLIWPVIFAQTLGNNQTANFQHLYVDNVSTNVDTGNVHVTAKRPFGNGSFNQFATQIGTGGSGYGLGHAPQVNERPLSTANGWQSNGTTAEHETYAIEGSTVGDESLAGGTQLAYYGWAMLGASAGTSPGGMVVNGADRSCSLTTTPTLFWGSSALSVTTDTATYPSPGSDIGAFMSAISTTALTVYPTGTAATTVTTADTLVTSSPTPETSHTTKTGKLTGWGVLFSQGSTGTWPAGVSEPAFGDVHGFILDATTLEGQTLLAGTYTAKAKVSTSSGTVTGVVHIRIGKRTSGGVYTEIVNCAAASTGFTSTGTVVTATGSGSATTFATGDKLYVQIDMNITANTSASTTATTSLFQNLGTNESIVTPGYQPAGLVQLFECGTVIAFIPAGGTSNPLTLSAVQNQIAFISRSTTKLVPTIQQNQLAIISRAMTHNIAASQNQIIIITKRITPSALTGRQNQLGAVTRSTSKSLPATQNQLAFISRTVNTIKSSIQNLITASPTKSITKTVPSASQNQIASVTKSITHLFTTAVQNQSAALARARTLILSAIQNQIASTQRTINISRTITQNQLATLGKSIAKTISATQNQTIALLRTITKSFSASQFQTATLAALKVFLKTLTAVQNQLAVLGPKTTNKIISGTQNQASTISRAIGKSTSAVQQQLTSVIKSISTSRSASLIQNATITKIITKFISTAIQQQLAVLTAVKQGGGVVINLIGNVIAQALSAVGVIRFEGAGICPIEQTPVVEVLRTHIYGLNQMNTGNPGAAIAQLSCGHYVAIDGMTSNWYGPYRTGTTQTIPSTVLITLQRALLSGTTGLDNYDLQQLALFLSN